MARNNLWRGRAHDIPPKLVAYLVIAAFWAVSLHNLTVVPRVYEDEPWQASTAWTLAREGVFASDVFAGLHGMEKHYYGYLPLHPMLLAVIFRTAGLGLFQARFEPAAMAVLALALTYGLARRLFKDARIGLLAILCLSLVRTTDQTPSQVSGILLLDMARIARYDMLVPVLGLSSLHAYLSASRSGKPHWYFLSGLLAGLSGLAHLYGLFFIPVLVLLVMWDRHGRRTTVERSGRDERRITIALLLAGAVLPWLPYLVYVLGGLDDWRGQTRGYGERFDLLNLQWYLDNLLSEYRRYGPGLGPPGPGVVLRAGFWSALAALPLSVGGLAWRALHGDRSARVVAVPAIALPVLFALLIHLKLSNYLVAIAPFGAMAAAWGGVMLWRWAGRRQWSRWARPALAALLIVVFAEGATRVSALEAAAATTTPYYRFIGAVRAHIPPGARVLGLHNYWFGLEDFDYRSFLVPLLRADQQNEPRSLPLDEALERVNPDVVLLDRRMREYFASAGQVTAARFNHWLVSRQAQLLARIDDPIYGLMEIYALPRNPKSQHWELVIGIWDFRRLCPEPSDSAGTGRRCETFAGPLRLVAAGRWW